MIQKFRNFDPQGFLDGKRVNEAVEDNATDTMEMPDNSDNEFTEEDVIDGTAVYEDPYLLKISNIIRKRLAAANIGKFSIFHDIVYLDDVPGVWFKGQDDNERDIVCCRDTNAKSISIFKGFKIGATNKAIVTYSTTKLGFTDMIDQLIEDLKETGAVNEEVVNEAGGFGDGYSEKNIANFKKLDWVDKEYMYDLLSKVKKGNARLELIRLYRSGDKTVNRILGTFGSVTDGSCKYIVGLVTDLMNNKYAGVNRDFDDLVAEYESTYKGGGPVIATRIGAQFEVTDEEAALEEKKKARQAAHDARIAEDTENLKETLIGLEDTATAMCHYVKQHGKLDREDKSVMSRRAILLTGKGGIGKTYTLKKVLKDNNMVQNRDYVWISSDSTTSTSLYSTMYEFNGKMIVFDDAPALFDGDYRISLWKNALQTDLDDCQIGCPKDGKANTYNVRLLKGDRQRRYFTEIGRKSADDKDVFYKKEMKKYGLKYSRYTTNGKPSIISDEGWEQEEIDVAMAKIDDAWKTEEENAQPAMPNTFIFTGCIIIISNVDRERFIDQVGKGSWGAIETRFRNFDISPLPESIWGVMKEKILKEYNDKSLNDDLCMIPREMTPEFIDEVESLIGDPQYAGINWRTVRAFGDILRGQKGLRTWKRQLRDELSITAA